VNFDVENVSLISAVHESGYFKEECNSYILLFDRHVVDTLEYIE
jgi:hypothetical protein